MMFPMANTHFINSYSGKLPTMSRSAEERHMTVAFSRVGEKSWKFLDYEYKIKYLQIQVSRVTVRKQQDV